MPIDLLFLDLKPALSLQKGLVVSAQALQALVVQVEHVLDLANGSKKAFSSSDF